MASAKNKSYIEEDIHDRSASVIFWDLGNGTRVADISLYCEEMEKRYGEDVEQHAKRILGDSDTAVVACAVLKLNAHDGRLTERIFSFNHSFNSSEAEKLRYREVMINNGTIKVINHHLFIIHQTLCLHHNFSFTVVTC